MVVFAGNGGNHFNPAVTLGLWTIRQIRTLRALSYIVAQMLGAWTAYYLYTYFTKTPLQPVTSSDNGYILVAEAVGAFVLTMAIAAALFRKYEGGKAAATVGGAMVLAMIVASTVYPPTVHMNGLANPALALSMRAFDVFGSLGWTTYALGPVLGAVIGFNLYALLFADESSFVRVRAVVSQRLARRTAPAKASAAAEAPAKARTTKAAPKRTARKSSARKSTARRSRK
jgi:glycerol uptake facilitator-like aquaporin